jgi:hypothetical protein
MKILSVHNTYQKPGGEDQVFAQEAELLRAHGHQVLLYQASNDQVTGVNPLVLLGNTIWNKAIHQELRALMRREKPDIVHVHNTFPVISPAVYYAANGEGIRAVAIAIGARPDERRAGEGGGVAGHFVSIVSTFDEEVRFVGVGWFFLLNCRSPSPVVARTRERAVRPRRAYLRKHWGSFSLHSSPESLIQTDS